MAVGLRIGLLVLAALAAACTGAGEEPEASDGTEPDLTTVAPEDVTPPPQSSEPEPERAIVPGAAQIADGEAEWMAVTILHVEEPDDPSEARLWGGVIVAKRPGVELDLERPWAGYGQGAVALDPDARHLLVGVLGALDECHSFGGIDVDIGSDEVRLAPRFVAPLEYWGPCLQPGPAVASPVDLGEPLGERALVLQRCVGEGWDDCEEMERYEPGDLPLAGETTVDCVPVDQIMHTQRAIHDLLVVCDPEARPIQGIVD
jgi:hypothetical protein